MLSVFQSTPLIAGIILHVCIFAYHAGSILLLLLLLSSTFCALRWTFLAYCKLKVEQNRVWSPKRKASNYCPFSADPTPTLFRWTHVAFVRHYHSSDVSTHSNGASRCCQKRNWLVRSSFFFFFARYCIAPTCHSPTCHSSDMSLSDTSLVRHVIRHVVGQTFHCPAHRWSSVSLSDT